MLPDTEQVSNRLSCPGPKRPRRAAGQPVGSRQTPGLHQGGQGCPRGNRSCQPYLILSSSHLVGKMSTVYRVMMYLEWGLDLLSTGLLSPPGRRQLPVWLHRCVCENSWGCWVVGVGPGGLGHSPWLSFSHPGTLSQCRVGRISGPAGSLGDHTDQPAPLFSDLQPCRLTSVERVLCHFLKMAKSEAQLIQGRHPSNLSCCFLQTHHSVRWSISVEIHTAQ